MDVLGCHLDYIHNELKPKWLGTPAGIVFIKALEVGRPNF